MSHRPSRIKEYKTSLGRYVIEVFHPKAFEDDVYTVDIHRKDKPRLDKYSERIMLEAKNKKDALKKFLKSREYQKYLRSQEKLDSFEK